MRCVHSSNILDHKKKGIKSPSRLIIIIFFYRIGVWELIKIAETNDAYFGSKNLFSSNFGSNDEQSSIQRKMKIHNIKIILKND